MLVLARTGHPLRLHELAARFEVSTETIRRDLEHLRAEGLVNRTIGGAVAADLSRDPGFEIRMRENGALRDRVARAALPLVEPGDVIFLSSGVTALQFAQHLGVSGMALTVITTSIRIANALAGNAAAEILLAPGTFDATEQSVGGPETLAFLEKFNVDRAVFGASGITEAGVTESRSAVAWTLRRMIRAANQAILLADHTRFGQRRLENVAPLSAIHVLVSDRPPLPPLAEALHDAGTRILVAD